MPPISPESARLAQIIFRKSTLEANTEIRKTKFLNEGNNDGIGLIALNVLLGSGTLIIINKEGQIDVNPQKLIDS